MNDYRTEAPYAGAPGTIRPTLYGSQTPMPGPVAPIIPEPKKSRTGLAWVTGLVLLGVGIGTGAGISSAASTPPEPVVEQQVPQSCLSALQSARAMAGDAGKVTGVLSDLLRELPAFAQSMLDYDTAGVERFGRTIDNGGATLREVTASLEQNDFVTEADACEAAAG